MHVYNGPQIGQACYSLVLIKPFVFEEIDIFIFLTLG